MADDLLIEDDVPEVLRRAVSPVMADLVMISPDVLIVGHLDSARSARRWEDEGDEDEARGWVTNSQHFPASGLRCDHHAR